MKYLFIIFLFFIYTTTFSQTTNNLVPNPSFEDTTGCPKNRADISKTTNWYSNYGTPDYMNSCAPDTGWINAPYVSVPNNYFGHQYASTGKAYVGFGAYLAPATPGNPNLNSREHISTKLIQPLIIGNNYHISFKLSSADILGNSYGYCCGGSIAVNKLGMYFSKDTAPNFSSGLPNFSHVYTNNVISDTTNWVTLNFEYLATDTFNVISIGGFFDDNNIDTTHMKSSPSFSYYYLDDIYVGNDNIPITVNLPSIKKVNPINIYPVPANDYLNIVNIKNIIQIKILDISGKTIKLSTTNSNIYIGDLPKGIYIIEINHDGTKSRKKFIKS